MLHSPEELARDPHQMMENVTFASMGINPSARDLHLGHYLTMYQFVQAIAASKHAEGICFIDDREFDLGPKNLEPSEHFYAPYRETTTAVMRKAIEALNMFAADTKDSSVRRRMHVRSMSDWMLDGKSNEKNKGEELFALIYNNRDAILKAFSTGMTEKSPAPLMRPFCPECGTGDRVATQIQETKNALMTTCSYRPCSKYGKSYVASPMTRDRNWSMFYAVDPLRDILFSRERKGKVMHVFGGDYGLAWGAAIKPTRIWTPEKPQGPSKAERLTTLIPKIAPDAQVDHYVGPLITKNGKKLAKSNGDRVSGFPQIDLLRSFLESGLKEVKIA